MSTHYQVFISSTYTDLAEQRMALVEATLKAGHFPVGMEFFAAGGERKWDYITRLIDASDYYVVIVAHWYGSVIPEEGGISYTEKEFDYAVKKGLRPIVLVLSERAEWALTKVEPDPVKKQRLAQFKNKIGQFMWGEWSSTSELEKEYLAALVQAFQQDPREGWVRASKSITPEIAREMARLSEENDRLTKQIATLGPIDSDAIYLPVYDKLSNLKAAPPLSANGKFVEVTLLHIFYNFCKTTLGSGRVNTHGLGIPYARRIAGNNVDISTIIETMHRWFTSLEAHELIVYRNEDAGLYTYELTPHGRGLRAYMTRHNLDGS